MRQYFHQGYSKFSFKKIVKKTEKATLFEIIPKIEIWLPNSWLIKLKLCDITGDQKCHALFYTSSELP